jgi:hypothetical protein
MNKVTKDEALKLALEALNVLLDEWTPARQAQLKGMEAITAINQAIEMRQEAVGEVSGNDWSTGILYRDLEPGAPLYANPTDTPNCFPVALEGGKRLIVVDQSFDELMYWLDRCEHKGHLENCPDLVEPYSAFQYENYPHAPAAPTKGQE